MHSVLMPDANAGSFLRVLVQALESSDLSSHAVANSASCCAPDLTPYRGYAREYVPASRGCYLVLHQAWAEEWYVCITVLAM